MTHIPDEQILQLHAKLVEVLGFDNADTLMSLLPRAESDRIADENGIARPVRSAM